MTNSNECLICKSSPIQISNTDDDKSIECPRCGYFSITFEAEVDWRSSRPDSRQVANACGWIREHQGIKIRRDDIDFLLSIATPSVAERAIKILKYFEKKLGVISEKFSFHTHNAKDLLGVSYSDNANELFYLICNYLYGSEGYILCAKAQEGVISELQITPKGYAFLASLKQNRVDSQIGFCAMWFYESVLPIWINAIQPAIKDAGYEPKRIDGHHHNNRIDDEIIAMLRRSKFVVADFTGQRGGVYFEAGFALGLGLQVVWTCKKSNLQKVHFDTRQYNFVRWEEDKLDDFKIALQNRIEATIGRGNFS